MERGMDRLQHPCFARAFARGVEGMDRGGAPEHRRRMLAGLAGSVIEIGAGTGSSFALYPPAVTHVLALCRSRGNPARPAARRYPGLLRTRPLRPPVPCCS